MPSFISEWQNTVCLPAEMILEHGSKCAGCEVNFCWANARWQQGTHVCLSRLMSKHACQLTIKPHLPFTIRLCLCNAPFSITTRGQSAPIDCLRGADLEADTRYRGVKGNSVWSAMALSHMRES